MGGGGDWASMTVTQRQMQRTARKMNFMGDGMEGLHDDRRDLTWVCEIWARIPSLDHQ